MPSPRVSAAELQREEERQEALFNSSRRGQQQQQQQQQQKGAAAAAFSPPPMPPLRLPTNCNKRADSIEGCISKLLQCEALAAAEVQQLCRKLSEVLVREPNCLAVETPVTVAGDIHGQFYDLLELFRVVFVLRGNHESRSITEVYGFYDECMRKFAAAAAACVYKSFMEVFDLLPLAAAVDNEYFCAHGGLSREITSIDQLQTINRQQEPPSEGGMSELLCEGFAPSSRGAGLLWGKEVTERFLHLNNLKCVCRAHQLVADGYQ
ncbi:Serine/threonine-protein phosphatase, related, partial [Eimeria tenella]